MIPNRFALSGLLLLLAYLALFQLIPGCANIIPPTGGPRDSLPPTLVKALPLQKTTGFNQKAISLEFNEYIQLDDLQNQLVVNPPFEKQAEVTGRLRVVSIKLRDSLSPNTTYSFQFGDAIRDINEGNKLSGFSYVFSTGNYIDSLMLKGTVLNAETGLPDSVLTVLLHQSTDDSAVAKQKPRYITRPNGKGEFVFANLPPGQFYVFALKDEGFRRYTSNKTPFAFLSAPVRSGESPAPVELRAFVAEQETAQATSASAASGSGKKKEEMPFQVKVGVSEAQPQDLLSPLMIQFTRKIRQIDSSRLHFTDTNRVAVRGYRLSLDTLSNTAKLSYPWKDGAYYELRLEKGFATDTAGITGGKADTIRFKTKGESEYGAVKLKITGLDTAAHPVLQWVEGGQVVQSQSIGSGSLNLPLFKPGEYNLRILYDTNKNGRWDTGNYWKKIQPEKVVALDKKFSVRANWENEWEITL